MDNIEEVGRATTTILWLSQLTTNLSLVFGRVVQVAQRAIKGVQYGWSILLDDKEDGHCIVLNQLQVIAVCKNQLLCSPKVKVALK